MLKPGDIGFTSNLEGGFFGFLADCIRFFTKSDISHSMVITQPMAGEETVIEAVKVVQVIPFDKYYRNEKLEAYEIFRIKPGIVTDKAIKKSLDYCFKEFAGVNYGTLQLAWFIWRWFNETVLKKDIRHDKNWMSDGVICSELVYYFLYNLGPVFRELIKDFNPDTIQAQDIKTICVNNPDLFYIVEIKLKPQKST